ncbi:MAG TPA: hypothetical protein VK816_04865 [Jatrophihabitantaceae bacterium]|jgi:hypothetical protein|nr:hypothetical protein [Jatrophihabitantaceae bacterium]
METEEEQRRYGTIAAGLKELDCFVPNFCARFPYSCGCGALIRARCTTQEAMDLLAAGQKLPMPASP